MGATQSNEENFIVQCSSGNLEAVQMLWKELNPQQNGNKMETIGVSPVNINAHLPDGDFALQLAAVNGHLPIVEFLVEEANCNVDECDVHGLTALMCAIRAGYVDVARYLILDGQADVDLADETGCTALMIAAQVNQNETVRLLLQARAKVDQCDLEGNTALMYATTPQTNSTSPSSSISAREDIITRLLLAGADPSIKNASRLTVWDVQRSVGSKDTLAMMRTAIRKRSRERQKVVFDTILNIYSLYGDPADEKMDHFIAVAVNSIMEYDNHQQVPTFIIESMTPTNSSRRSSVDPTAALLYRRQASISTNDVGYSLIPPASDTQPTLGDLSNDTVIEMGKMDISSYPSSPSGSSPHEQLLNHYQPNISSSMSYLFQGNREKKQFNSLDAPQELV